MVVNDEHEKYSDKTKECERHSRRRQSLFSSAIHVLPPYAGKPAACTYTTAGIEKNLTGCGRGHRPGCLFRGIARSDYLRANKVRIGSTATQKSVDDFRRVFSINCFRVGFSPLQPPSPKETANKKSFAQKGQMGIVRGADDMKIAQHSNRWAILTRSASRTRSIFVFREKG